MVGGDIRGLALRGIWSVGACYSVGRREQVEKNIS